MVFITYTIFDAFIKLFLIPEAPAVLSPVLPGVKIPGSEIYIPFWQGIISIFIVILVHEASHGFVSSAFKIKIRSTGIGFLGPLPLAFVEPDEEKLKKESDVVKYSIFAAGPFSNVLLALAALALLSFVVAPIGDRVLATEG